MLRAIWPNQFWIKLFITLLCVRSAYAQQSVVKSAPIFSSGIIEPLSKDIIQDKQSLQRFKSQTQTSATQVIGAENITQFRIAPIQMASIILFTPSRYINWAKDNSCKFLALLENGLIRDSQGTVRKIALYVKNKETGEDEYIAVGVKRFIHLSYSNQCIKNRNYQTLFKPENLQRTLKRLEIHQPKDLKNCEEQFNGLKKNEMTPYLCGIVEKHKKLRSYQKLQKQLKKQGKVVPFALSASIRQITKSQESLKKYQQTYLREYCNNLVDARSFCKGQLNTDLWTDIISGVKPEYLISYICTSLSPKQKLTSSDLRRCISVIKDAPQACLTANYHSYPSLLPHPDCDLLKLNLSHSRLYTDYVDCPGFLSNTYITNISRIIKHFEKKPRKEESCTDSAYGEVAQLFYKFDPKKSFDTKICFRDPIKEKNICYSYLPGAGNSLPQSESKVLAKILNKIRGIPEDTQCRMANFNKFNPHLLEYKNGCVITYKDRSCTTSGCPKNIYYNSLPMSGLKYEGKLRLQYRPSRFTQTQYAINRQLSKVYKIKEKIIHNLTEVKFFLNLNPENIIHGVGCAEDIYPIRFPRTSLNQCRILPFIIDGFRKEKNQTLLITRTSIDDLHSPRAINWVHLYSAVRSFQQIHPLNSWTLYGLRK